jgi:hypothetical protein
MTERATGERRIAELRNYEDLVVALGGMVSERQISLSDLDELSGLQAGYNGKCLGQARVKKYGPMSMWLVMQTLGVRLVMIEDAEALAAMQERYTKKDVQQSRPQNHSSPAGKGMMSRVFKHFARLGGRARMKKMTKAQRSEHARDAINARWRRIRKLRRGSLKRKAGRQPKNERNKERQPV